VANRTDGTSALLALDGTLLHHHAHALFQSGDGRLCACKDGLWGHAPCADALAGAGTRRARPPPGSLWRLGARPGKRGTMPRTCPTGRPDAVFLAAVPDPRRGPAATGNRKGAGTGKCTGEGTGPR
jgi:hypothetical protein